MFYTLRTVTVLYITNRLMCWGGEGLGYRTEDIHSAALHVSTVWRLSGV